MITGNDHSRMTTLVLLSGGLDSAVLAAHEAQTARVLPLYVSVGLAWEDAEVAMVQRLLAAAYHATPDEGTRTTTVVHVRRYRSVVIVERSFGPGGAPGEEVSYEIEITGA
jgi:uncharacterized protein with NRDE domain